MRLRYPLLMVCGLAWTCSAQNLSDSQVSAVVDRLAGGATHSWELGTRAQALLELQAPFWSVFANSTFLPPPHAAPFGNFIAPIAPSAPFNGTNVSDPSGPPRVQGTDLSGALSIAEAAVRALSNVGSAQPLTDGEGAAGDPASLGVAVLLANWTASSNATLGGNATQGNATLDYAAAARGQLEFLLTQVQRTSDGAISHRLSQVQLWSDSVYMVPPFIAYYGALTSNASLLSEAYNQCKLYRSYLRDSKAGLWRHIVLGSGTDEGHWSTGNGWAAAGIMRVWATINRSSLASQFQSELTDLKNWAIEIVGGMYSHSTKDHLFLNYADNGTTFEDAAGAALVASVSYRLATHTQTYHWVPDAERTRKQIASSQIDDLGWLTPVVDPLDFANAGAHSPEGQSFVVEMQAAWRDWVDIGAPGANGAARAGHPIKMLLVLMTGMLVTML